MMTQLLLVALIISTILDASAEPGDCYESASTYTGSTSTTESGRTCQNWSEQKPHEHNVHDKGLHKYRPYWQSLGQTSAEAKNYCRDPDNSGAPWCYTQESGKRWEYCSVPKCALGKRVRCSDNENSDHIVDSCDQCPEDHGGEWCNGDCMWRKGQCISGEGVKTVSCGEHRAASCAECFDWKNKCGGDCHYFAQMMGDGKCEEGAYSSYRHI